MRRTWTHAEDKYLRKHYGPDADKRLPVADIASHLSRSVDSVVRHAEKLYIRRDKYRVSTDPARHWKVQREKRLAEAMVEPPEDERRVMASLSHVGKTLAEIAESSGLSLVRTRCTLRRLREQVVTCGRWHRLRRLRLSGEIMAILTRGAR